MGVGSASSNWRNLSIKLPFFVSGCYNWKFQPLVSPVKWALSTFTTKTTLSSPFPFLQSFPSWFLWSQQILKYNYTPDDQSKPLSINISSSRDWRDMYWFLEIVRYPEILDYYRKKGLGFLRYIYCKNYSLKDYSYLMFKIFFSKKTMGKKYFNFYDHLLRNLLYPNSYLSFFSICLKKQIVF